jgi:hypothetical protein
MHLHDGAVQRHGLDLDAHDLGALQLLEHPVEHAVLGPAVHTGVDRVPVAEPLGQAPPLAAMLGHVEDRVENLEIGQADVASLHRHAVGDALVLGFGDFHPRIALETLSFV